METDYIIYTPSENMMRYYAKSVGSKDFARWAAANKVQFDTALKLARQVFHRDANQVTGYCPKCRFEMRAKKHTGNCSVCGAALFPSCITCKHSYRTITCSICAKGGDIYTERTCRERDDLCGPNAVWYERVAK